MSFLTSHQSVLPFCHKKLQFKNRTNEQRQKKIPPSAPKAQDSVRRANSFGLRLETRMPVRRYLFVFVSKSPVGFFCTNRNMFQTVFIPTPMMPDGMITSDTTREKDG